MRYFVPDIPVATELESQRSSEEQVRRPTVGTRGERVGKVRRRLVKRIFEVGRLETTDDNG